MVWLFRSRLFGEKIITLKNGGVLMILKSFQQHIDTRLKDFLKHYPHIFLAVPYLKIIFQNHKHLQVPLHHLLQPPSYLLLNAVEFRNSETLKMLKSLLFLFTPVKEDLQCHRMEWFPSGVRGKTIKILHRLSVSLLCKEDSHIYINVQPNYFATYFFLPTTTNHHSI